MIYLITNGGDPIPRIAAITRALPGQIAIQVREKQLDGGPLLRLVRDVIAAANGAPVWVNDRADVAKLAGAHGVHLPEHGMPVADARAFGLAVGASRHSAADALACDADIVQLGPVFDTPGKPTIGLEPIHAARSKALIAVGGIATAEHARLAVAAGATGIAVIRAAWDSEDPVAVVQSLVAGMKAGLS
ncbi:MAG: thiamine phosphate synthase [Kofleriaceae bacterium]